MEKIFDQAKDKNVSAVIIYGNTETESTPTAYVDSACTVKFKTSELKDAFLKRAVILIGEEYFIPTGFSVDSKIGKVTYAKAGSAANSAATATLSSIAD